MNPAVQKSFKSKLIFGKYSLKYLISKGSFGEVYMGTNIFNKKNYAIKIEKINSSEQILKQEAYILFLLKGPGIPSVVSFGVSCKYHILVEELLGDSIYKIFIKSGNKFNLKDTCMFAIQALERIEYVHSKDFLHRDIKPGNFLVGNPDKSQIYLIDFGNAKKFRSSRTGKYQRYNNNKRLYGTIVFLSLNVLKGGEQTRKDELESLGLLFIYLHKGFLPWSQIKTKNIYQAIEEVIILKQNTSFKELCAGMPQEMVEYLDYINKLGFKDNPNYAYLRSLFVNILKKIGEKNDLMFSWVDKKVTPNRIISTSKTKTLKRIYDNILSSNSNKNISPVNSNKNVLNQPQILSTNNNRSGVLNLNMINSTNPNSNFEDKINPINIIYTEDNNEKINLNKKIIPKTVKSNNYIKRRISNNNGAFSQKIRLIKKEDKLNLMNLSSKGQQSLLNQYNQKNQTKQNMIKNTNNNFSQINKKKPNNIKVNQKANVKFKNYLLGIQSQKNGIERSRNQKWVNINNININKFPNNNYTYVTIIKNPDMQKLNISQKNTKYIITESDYQNNITQNSSALNYKPYFYKSVFTSGPYINSNIKNITEKVIKQNQTYKNNNKKCLKIQTEKIITKLNANTNKKNNFVNQRNSKNLSYTNTKPKTYTPKFSKGGPQTFNNSPKKIKNL